MSSSRATKLTDRTTNPNDRPNRALFNSINPRLFPALFLSHLRPATQEVYSETDRTTLQGDNLQMTTIYPCPKPCLEASLFSWL